MFLKKLRLSTVAFLASCVALVGAAHAALDASIATTFAAVQTDATALSAIVVPIVVAILGLTLVIKLVKRFGNKI